MPSDPYSMMEDQYNETWDMLIKAQSRIRELEKENERLTKEADDREAWDCQEEGECWIKDGPFAGHGKSRIRDLEFELDTAAGQIVKLREEVKRLRAENEENERPCAICGRTVSQMLGEEHCMGCELDELRRGNERLRNLLTMQEMREKQCPNG